jgi:tRNA nucleotidyltransferase (CCA-adding enzyme)
MQVYLVGGAVRDELLGLPAAERDWVVVGATPEELEHAGFRSVGREFPVFLHPETHEEYALARLERKTAPGYRGFTTRFSPDVTLEQDLQRRDLTINAMARSADGALVDPYGGQRDLELRLLRHVSPAFVEDPVRVLRLARFAARLATLGFKLAPETQALLRTMVANGEISALVPERVWREMQRALGEASPEVFFDLLQECGALAVLVPELHWGEAERSVLRRAVRIGAEPAVRFASLLATTPAEAIGALCERLRVPNEFRDLALLGARLQGRLAHAHGLDAPQMLELLEAADAFRRPDRFAQLLRVAQAASGLDDAGREAVTAALFTATSVTLPREQTAQLPGLAIAAAYRQARIERLRALLK